MKTKSKKTKTPVHYHICGCGEDAHKWGHKGECNLSKHAHCGHSLVSNNSVANYPACLRKHPKIALATEKRFDYKADSNGYVILYKGEPVAKERLTKKEQKIKRHPSTVKKAARDYQYNAQKLVAMLDDGNGDKKVWAKIRKVDKSLKTEAVTLDKISKPC